MNSHNTQDLSDEEWLELERRWRDSQPKMSDKQLYESFLKGSDIIDSKLREIDDEIIQVRDQINNLVGQIAKASENDRILGEVLLKHGLIKEQCELERQRRQLLRYKYISKKHKSPSGHKLDVESARNYPILSLAEQYTRVRRTGKTFVGRCPLHDDRSPSFYVYPESNSFYCFGCNKGGNGINLVMEKEQMAFKDAVHFINNC